MSFQYPYQNFYQAILANKSDSPNKTIVYDGDLKFSNQKLLDYVDAIASHLVVLNVKPGDKVAIVLGNSWQFIASFFAISKVGGIIVPINYFLKEDEIAYILNDAQTKLLIAHSKFEVAIKNQLIKSTVEKIIWVDNAPLDNDNNLDFNRLLDKGLNSVPLINTPPEELSLIVYTSGTTGKPKGAMLSFKNILSNVCSCMEKLQVKPGKVKMIAYLPMFHAFTLTATVLLPIISNSGVVIIRSISSKGDFAYLLKQVLLKRVTYFAGVPDVYNALSKAKLPWYFHWLHNVRGFISGAAPLAEKTINQFNQNFKRGVLIEGYGISECSPIVSTNTPLANKIGSVGTALPGYQVECFDEEGHQLDRGVIGEICVKGDCVMLGYYNRIQDTKDSFINDWFKTGDIGKVDKEGFIFIVDRKKDLIISKGMNIYPREIEEIIYTNEKVNACAVVGVKEADGNETPITYIELKENATATESEFREFLRPHLALFKQPRKYVFIDKLPRNATGKILKRELREMNNVYSN